MSNCRECNGRGHFLMAFSTPQCDVCRGTGKNPVHTQTLTSSESYAPAALRDAWARASGIRTLTSGDALKSAWRGVLEQARESGIYTPDPAPDLRKSTYHGILECRITGVEHFSGHRDVLTLSTSRGERTLDIDRTTMRGISALVRLQDVCRLEVGESFHVQVSGRECLTFTKVHKTATVHADRLEAGDFIMQGGTAQEVMAIESDPVSSHVIIALSVDSIVCNARTEFQRVVS